MQTVIIFMVGFLIGGGLAVVILRGECVGTLRVDTSDSDGPFIFLEASESIDTIASKKSIILRVDLKNCISHS